MAVAAGARVRGGTAKFCIPEITGDMHREHRYRIHAGVAGEEDQDIRIDLLVYLVRVNETFIHLMELVRAARFLPHSCRTGIQ